MAAWVHTAKWNDTIYSKYQSHVRKRGYEYEGRTEDCADLCKTVLIDFAADNGLPVTFKDGAGRLYQSQGRHSWESLSGLARDLYHYAKDGRQQASWSSRETYARATTGVSAEALMKYNTAINPIAPQSGDLMLSKTHAALVLAYYLQPRQRPENVPLFPGAETASKQHDQTRYYRCDPDAASRLKRPEDRDALGTLKYNIALYANGCAGDPMGYFDYLNHRGVGGKEKAELIYNASIEAMKKDGFQFRAWSTDVLRWWTDEELRENLSAPS